jgi:hypothetical protein
MAGLHVKALAFEEIKKKRVEAFKQKKSEELTELNKIIQNKLAALSQRYDEETVKLNAEAKRIGIEGGELEKNDGGEEAILEIKARYDAAALAAKNALKFTKKIAKIAAKYEVFKTNPEAYLGSLQKLLTANADEESLLTSLEAYTKLQIPGEYMPRNLFLPVFTFCLTSETKNMFVHVGIENSGGSFMASADLGEGVFDEDIEILESQSQSIQSRLQALEEVRIASLEREDEVFLDYMNSIGMGYPDFRSNNREERIDTYKDKNWHGHSERVFSRVLRDESTVINLVRSLTDKVPTIEQSKFTVCGVTILAYSTNRVCDSCTRDLVALTHDWDSGDGSKGSKGFMALLADSIEGHSSFRVLRPDSGQSYDEVLSANMIVSAGNEYPSAYMVDQEKWFQVDDSHSLEVSIHSSAAIAIVDEVEIKDPFMRRTFVETVVSDSATASPEYVRGNIFISGLHNSDYANTNCANEKSLEYKMGTDTALREKAVRLDSTGSSLVSVQYHSTYYPMKDMMIVPSFLCMSIIENRHTFGYWLGGNILSKNQEQNQNTSWWDENWHYIAMHALCSFGLAATLPSTEFSFQASVEAALPREIGYASQEYAFSWTKQNYATVMNGGLDFQNYSNFSIFIASALVESSFQYMGSKFLMPNILHNKDFSLNVLTTATKYSLLYLSDSPNLAESNCKSFIKNSIWLGITGILAYKGFLKQDYSFTSSLDTLVSLQDIFLLVNLVTVSHSFTELALSVFPAEWFNNLDSMLGCEPPFPANGSLAE